MPAIISKFENQSIQTFFGNTKIYGDLPFTNYFGFETMLGNMIYNCTLYPVSYAFVVTFHPKLDIEKTFVVRNFNHTLEQLNDISYLANKMLPYFDPITAWQLRDCALAVIDFVIDLL